jgi:hypothetical protein
MRNAILREMVLTGGAEPTGTYHEFRGHPDLADLFYPNQ